MSYGAQRHIFARPQAAACGAGAAATGMAPDEISNPN
jgi:hypothetical protein